MKLDIKICWIRDVCNPVWAPPLYKKGDVNTIRIDCDYIDDKGDLLSAIQDVVGDFAEHDDFEILNEEQFWQDMDCPASEITNPQALVKDDHGITKERVKKALQVLIDNGIEEDEAGTVLQALGYALLDVELESMIEE